MDENNDPIRAYQKNLGELAEKAEWLRPILRSCQDAIQRAGSKAIPMLKTNGSRPLIDVMLMAKSLDEVVPLQRELAKEGIHSKEKKFEDGSLCDTIAIRAYKLTEDVIMSVWLMGGSCQRVQVGTKTVPVYDIKCGQEPWVAPMGPAGLLTNGPA